MGFFKSGGTKSFRVAIEDIETIFEAVSRPLPHPVFLGYAPLSNPASEIRAMIDSDSRYYFVSAQIDIGSKNQAQHNLNTLVLNALEAKLKVRRIANHLFILNKNGDLEIAIEWRNISNINIFGAATSAQTLIVSMGEAASVIRKSLNTLKNFSEEMRMFALGLKYPETYKRWGTNLPKGILLYGPPGSGKTLLAKAVATVVDCDILQVDINNVVSKWYGVAEKLMQGVFDIARANKKISIIFFDEIDAIASRRNSSHEATQHIVAVLLKNLDGLALLPNVMVIATTNRLEAVDPAFRRSGRIDRLIEVPIPDLKGREEIFDIHAKKAERMAERTLFEGVNWQNVAMQTQEFSGADIAEIVRRTLEAKVRKEFGGGEAGLVSMEDVLKELKEYNRAKKSLVRIGF